MDENIVA